MMQHDLPTSILVLGSGQLGLMMAAEGARLGMHVDRLNLKTAELLHATSAAGLSVAVETLCAQYPIITAELEHIGDCGLIRTIKACPHWQNREAFELLPHRTTQKQLYDKLNLATSPWRVLESEDDIHHAKRHIAPQLVVKSTRDGYDGKGQWRLFDDDSELPPASLHGELIAEARIDFSKEVSIVGARSRDGSVAFLPLAENTHHNGILRYTIAAHLHHPAQQQQAEQMLGCLMSHLDYVGTMAMECFVTPEGLLINEVAPRVHNSGHWSQLGATHSQFALHLYSLLGATLTPGQSFEPTLMLNLIGCDFNPAWLSVGNMQCWWYGKDVRPERKLGHINIRLADVQTVSAQLMPLLDDAHQQHLSEALGKL